VSDHQTTCMLQNSCSLLYIQSYQTSDPTSLYSRALHRGCSVHRHLECRRLEPGLNQALDDQPREIRAIYRDECSINTRLIDKDPHDLRKIVPGLREIWRSRFEHACCAEDPFSVQLDCSARLAETGGAYKTTTLFSFLRVLYVCSVGCVLPHTRLRMQV
jgi:hypothetical protein